MFLVLVLAVAASPIVTLDSGKVRGLSFVGYSAFFGVPYGSARVRFSDPEPVQPWSGVRSAEQRAPGCFQPGLSDGVEDCLFLDVYVPSANVTKSLVWIHGGGFFLGNSADYDSSALARKGKAIIFVINYRLGPFGFLPQRPNLGLKDQQFALKWIQRNVAAFGGSPDSVVISGESAGGGSVVAHLISPGSAGLFGGAALLSPATSQQFPCEHLLPYGQELMRAVNCSDLACLATLPTAAQLVEKFLSNVFPQRGFTAAPFAPCLDGEVLITTTVNAQNLPAIPILVGATAVEGALFSWLDATQPPGVMFDMPERATSLLQLLASQTGANASTVLNLYPPLSLGSWKSLSQAYGDVLINCIANYVGSKISNARRYVFDSFDPAASNAYLGATHANDVPFWFNNRSVPFGLAPGVPAEFPPGYSELADRMSTLLLTFDEEKGNSSQILVLSQVGDKIVDAADPTPACLMWLDIFKQKLK